MDNRNITVSWLLKYENVPDREFIEILEKHKEYGFTTRTKLIAAALKEYRDNHKKTTEDFSLF